MAQKKSVLDRIRQHFVNKNVPDFQSAWWMWKKRALISEHVILLSVKDNSHQNDELLFLIMYL